MNTYEHPPERPPCVTSQQKMARCRFPTKSAAPPASGGAWPPAEQAEPDAGSDGIFSRRRLHDAMRRYVQRYGSTGTANPQQALHLAAHIAAITIVIMKIGSFIRRRSAPVRATLVLAAAAASAILLSTRATLTASVATAPVANEAVVHDVCGEAASDEDYVPWAAAIPSRSSREAVLLDADHLSGVFECLALRDRAAAAVCRAWRAAWVQHLEQLRLLVPSAAAVAAPLVSEPSAAMLLPDGRLCVADKLHIALLSYDRCQVERVLADPTAPLGCVLHLRSDGSSLYALEKGGRLRRFGLACGAVLARTDSLVSPVGTVRPAPPAHAMELYRGTLYVVTCHAFHVLSPETLVVLRKVSHGGIPNLRGMVAVPAPPADGAGAYTSWTPTPLRRHTEAASASPTKGAMPLEKVVTLTTTPAKGITPAKGGTPAAKRSDYSSQLTFTGTPAAKRGDSSSLSPACRSSAAAMASASAAAARLYVASWNDGLYVFTLEGKFLRVLARQSDSGLSDCGLLGDELLLLCHREPHSCVEFCRVRDGVTLRTHPLCRGLRGAPPQRMAVGAGDAVVVIFSARRMPAKTTVETLHCWSEGTHVSGTVMINGQ